jgi:CheY-like chemotaxis protein
MLKKLILVVDDDPIVRQLMDFVLRPKYDTVLAEDGLAGLLAYEEYGGDFAAVVTDFTMPNLNGDLFIQQLRQRNPTLPIVMMTGTMLHPEMQHQLAIARVKLVQKPFSTTEIRQAIQESLGTATVLRL